jgi:hypothetical protein
MKPSIQIRNSIANHKTSVGITGEILNIAMLGPVSGGSGGREGTVSSWEAYPIVEASTQFKE